MRARVGLCAILGLAACDPRPLPDVGFDVGVDVGFDAEPDAAIDAGSIPDAGVAPDAAAPDADAPDADAPDADPPSRCQEPEPNTPGPASTTDERGTAQVSVEVLEPCRRRYTLETTAELRDPLRPKTRTIEEGAGDPVLRSGSPLFDAVYALAVREAREASVATIHDGAFDNGQPLACAAPGCFETGASWPWVWTRDTAYATELALAALDPSRARVSLKLSRRRDGSDLQVVQDTGSGGSYPISSDRVVWALGARALLGQLSGGERDQLRDTSYEALANTAAHDRAVLFDPADGLYRGETSFLDWREQSYAPWTANDTAQIGMSKALSTNVLHHAALRLLSQLATERAEATAAAAYQADADALRVAIRARFGAGTGPLWPSIVPGTLDPAPIARFDALSLALAVLEEIATPAEARALIAAYPHAPHGPPVIWPQDRDAAIYHNRAVWPFVTAYWVRAAAKVRNDRVATAGALGLFEDAALQLSNVENLELASGRPFVDDGPRSGPVVSSLRQLWSVAGSLALVERVIFGRDATADGLVLSPYLTRALRAELFPNTRRIALSRLPHRGRVITIVLNLPPLGADRDGAYAVGPQRESGGVIEIDLLDTPEAAAGMRLVDTTDAEALYAPRTPSITGLIPMADGIDLGIDRAGETVASIGFNVYRDGARIATSLGGTTISYVDTGSNNTSPSVCYTLESYYLSSNNVSHRAKPVCFWGPGSGRITNVGADQLVSVGGTFVLNHGREHYQDWGDAGHSLTLPSFTPARTGAVLLQVLAGNGSGPIATGITCAVKRIRVIDTSDASIAGEGYLLLPQLGSWSEWRESSFVPATLRSDRSYRVVIDGDDRAINMSSFAHFARYTGGTGGATAFNRVNIAELKILSLVP